MFKGCIVMKLDANYIQGIPDLLILFKDKWAVLECKKFSKAAHRPNQDYYVDILNKMSFETKNAKCVSYCLKLCIIYGFS